MSTFSSSLPPLAYRLSFHQNRGKVIILRIGRRGQLVALAQKRLRGLFRDPPYILPDAGKRRPQKMGYGRIVIADDGQILPNPQVVLLRIAVYAERDLVVSGKKSP